MYQTGAVNCSSCRWESTTIVLMRVSHREAFSYSCIS